MRQPELAVPLVVALADGRDRRQPAPAQCARGSTAGRQPGRGDDLRRVRRARPRRPVTPTFAGYVKLDDTATSLGMLDWTLEHGTSVTGLAPSTYEAMLTLWLGDGYPDRQPPAPRPYAHRRRRPGMDVAALPVVPRGSPRARPVRARRRGRPVADGCGPLLAVTAAASALLYGYALWGGVKEIFASAIARSARCDGAAALAVRRQGPRSFRRCAGAALLDALSAAGAIWLVPLAHRRRRRRVAPQQLEAARGRRRRRVRSWRFPRSLRGQRSSTTPPMSRAGRTTWATCSARSASGSSPASGRVPTSASTRATPGRPPSWSRSRWPRASPAPSLRFGTERGGCSCSSGRL